MVIELFKYMVADYNDSLNGYEIPTLGDVDTINDIKLCMEKLNSYDFDKAIATLQQLKVKKETFKTTYTYAKDIIEEQELESEINEQNDFLDYQKSLLLEEGEEEIANFLRANDRYIPALGDPRDWKIKKQHFKNGYFDISSVRHWYISKDGYCSDNIKREDDYLFYIPLEELTDATRLTAGEHPMVEPCELLNFGLYRSDKHGYFALQLENDEE